MFNLSVEILRSRDIEDVWLLTDQAAEGSWHSLGLKETGEIDKETGQKIMIINIKQDNCWRALVTTHARAVLMVLFNIVLGVFQHAYGAVCG